MRLPIRCNLQRRIEFRLCRVFHFLVALAGSLVIGNAIARTPSIAVVIPDVREPYRAVFVAIARGMEEELGQPVTRYLLSDQQDSTEKLIDRMKGEHIDVAVMLGRSGFLAAKSVSRVLPVVIGAVTLTPEQDHEGLSGITLNPDPEILFARLRELAPNARDVTVIYDPKQGAEEIEQAREAAQRNGLTLRAMQAADLRVSAATYQKLLPDIEDGSVAIWLQQNNAAMDEEALLPLLLRASWDKRFIVFSSSLEHVRRGALFSLYPDSVGMGRRLAAMARSRAQGGANRNTTIEPLRDVLTAVNLRTAEHLGLNFSSATTRKFGMTFPPRQ